ncbi:hypothetical protein U1Q18_007908 [Sarracenia purpurea var. burkii]
MRAFDEAANISSGRFLTALPILFRIKRFFKLGSERRLAKSVATVHQFADKIIKGRLEGKAEQHDEDLLSRFIRTDEMSKDLLLLRDVVITSVLERFEFDIQPSHKNPDYTISLTLRMKGGLPVKVRERSAV